MRSLDYSSYAFRKVYLFQGLGSRVRVPTPLEATAPEHEAATFFGPANTTRRTPASGRSQNIFESSAGVVSQACNTRSCNEGSLLCILPMKNTKLYGTWRMQNTVECTIHKLCCMTTRTLSNILRNDSEKLALASNFLIPYH